jgi:RNA polymerase sigma-70 factor (ECF subfamily)
LTRITLDFDLYWQKIQNGELFALEKVYKTAFQSLVYYAREITGQPELAEEVVQDIFLKIWMLRSELSIKGSFKAYLFQSVHNHSLNAIRQQKTRKESVNLPGSDIIWRFISDNYETDDNLIERIFSDETEIIIERLIKGLPEQCRKIFLMSRYELLNNEEIAIRMGISENTVKTHIYRALQKISIGLNKEN